MADQDLNSYSAVTTPNDSSLLAVRANGDGLWRKLTWANLKAAVRDLAGSKLTLDADSDTSIHADTDDQIDFEVGGSDVLRVTSMGLVAPVRSQKSSIQINDDAFSTIDFDGNAQGVVVVSGSSTLAGAALVHFGAASGGATSADLGSSISSGSVVVTTGALGGTTGSDGNLTISAHTDNKIYIENRTGSNHIYQVTILSLSGSALSSL